MEGCSRWSQSRADRQFQTSKNLGIEKAVASATPLPCLALASIRQRAAARRHRASSGEARRQSSGLPAYSGRFSGFSQLWSNGNPQNRGAEASRRSGHPYVLFSGHPVLRLSGCGVFSSWMRQGDFRPSWEALPGEPLRSPAVVRIPGNAVIGSHGGRTLRLSVYADNLVTGCQSK